MPLRLATLRDAKGRPPYMDRKRGEDGEGGKDAGTRTLGQGRKKGGPMGRLFSWLAVRLLCGRCAEAVRQFFGRCAEAAPDALIQRQEPRQRGPQ